MRDTLAQTIYEMAKKNDKITVLVGDVGVDVFYKFRKEFPDRFYNMGLSEANMIHHANNLYIKP